MRRTTIKYKLYTTAIGILFILLIIGFATNYFIQNAFSNLDAMSIIKDINNSELQLRKLEKDFINFEMKNIDFYKNSQTVYLKNFKQTVNEVKLSISKLEDERIIQQNNLAEDLKMLQLSFDTYGTTFDALVDEVLKKGFKDFGMIGKMREKIHLVETQTKAYKNYPEFTIYMLTLRRNEKDYLLRKDVKYKSKFEKNLQAFVGEILASNISKKEEFTVLLSKYNQLFEAVINSDIKIGLTGKNGQIHRLNKLAVEIESHVNTIQKQIEVAVKKEVNRAISTLFIVSIVLALVIMTVLIGVTRRILISIKKLRSFILKLGNGELPNDLLVKKNDEIADMIKSINTLLANLRNTREFAIEVGKGHLNKQINVFNNRGDLGGALIEMRQQLLKLDKERVIIEEKEKQRNWLNEGVALFSDIMRRHESNLKEMCYDVLSEIINYTDSNQGAIFIVNRDDEKKPFLKKIAAVAYNRKKIAGESIEFGKDMVGRVAFEKKEIHLQNVPDDYIKITSGLGYATPRQLFLAPIMKDDTVLGVIELASFNEYKGHIQQFILRICSNLGMTISAIQTNKMTQKLLEQAQEQAEEITSQEEELRQNMEEMKATQEEASRREMLLHDELSIYKNTIPIIELSPNGIIINVNKNAQQIMGIAEEQLKNSFLLNFIPKNTDQNKINQLLRKLSVKGKNKFIEEYNVQIFDNLVQITATAIQNKCNEIEKIIMILHSVAPTKEIQTNIQNLQFSPELNNFN